MDQILRIDPGEQIAVVQPGVVNAVLFAAVAGHGLFYSPDPASWESTTIGGNVATNAAGPCCVKHGVTGDFVRALEVVLADGTVLRTGRRTAKGRRRIRPHPPLRRLEGTLGVVTEVTVALRPRPVALTAAATFTTSRTPAGPSTTTWPAARDRP